MRKRNQRVRSASFRPGSECAGWSDSNDRIRFDVLCDDGSWANNGSIPDGDTLQDHRTNTDEHVGSDVNRRRIHGLTTNRRSGNDFMLVVGDDDSVSDQAVVADRDPFPDEQMDPPAEENVVANLDLRVVGRHVEPDVRLEHAPPAERGRPGTIELHTLAEQALPGDRRPTQAPQVRSQASVCNAPGLREFPQSATDR